jgi:hypothetical protein
MAQTDAGHKFIRVPAYIRQMPSGPVKVAPHIRSTPHVSDGAKKGK